MKTEIATTTKRRGPRSTFGPKHPPNRSYSLTKLAQDILGGNSKRTRENESNIVELLVRVHGGPQLDALIKQVQADAASA